ncbi:hypothetical protein AKJ09_01840 [Labilithrix luteola]|uniref:Knr4/Smi1-like domain-containing protein n=1 Tax=Labilithrix luteola TaxID=1391654 RepID=A0A0K1PP41_9BACT|nr:SMI1/KNR4 family protein [Labilithrix luteola]AKU95176.1 hypothetical protein AKJ09_01840 [Labilithrix luteola]
MATTKKSAGATKKAPSLAATLERLVELTSGKKRPATRAELDAVAVALGGVPADLRALYGVAGNLGSVIQGTALEWLDVGDAVTSCRQNREFGVPESLFPIATDGAGNFSCFDRDSGRILDWDHEARATRALAPTLSAYLEKSVVRELGKAQTQKRALEKERGQGLSFGTRPSLPSKLVPLAKATGARLAGDCVCLLEEGRIAVGNNNRASIVDLETLAEKAEIPGGAYDMAFESASRRIVRANFGQMSLADGVSGKLLARFQAKNIGHWAAILLAAGGSLAITYSTTPKVEFWDLASGKGIPRHEKGDWAPSYDLPEGKPVATLAAHKAWVRSARVSPDGTMLVSGDDEGKLCLARIADRSLVWSTSFREPIKAVDFAADGRSIFVGLESGKVHVLDVGGKKLRTFRVAEEIIGLRVLDDGLLLVLLWTTLTVCDPMTGKVMAQAPTGKNAHMSRIADVRGDVVVLSRPTAFFRIV